MSYQRPQYLASNDQGFDLEVSVVPLTHFVLVTAAEPSFQIKSMPQKQTPHMSLHSVYTVGECGNLLSVLEYYTQSGLDCAEANKKILFVYFCFLLSDYSVQRGIFDFFLLFPHR